MQEKRLELSRDCSHTDLNRARLPIPPFLRTNDILLDTRMIVKRNFSDFCITYFVLRIAPALEAFQVRKFCSLFISYTFQ